MTEQEASNAVDAAAAIAVGGVDAIVAAALDQPTIDTSVWNDAETTEPMLKGPCSPVCTISKFAPAVSGDGNLYGWSFDLVLDEPVDTNLGGQFPPGKSFNFLKVFTVAKDPSDVVKAKATKGRALKVIAALNGIVVEKSDSAQAILAKMTAAGVTALAQTPLPTDRDQSHYDQHVGKHVKAHLKPNGLDKNGYPQVDLQGLTAVVGAQPSPY